MDLVKQDNQLNEQEIKQYICPNADDKEFKMFMELCRSRNLNPFLKEVYFIKYGDRNPAQIVVGKDALIKRAKSNSKYKGFKAGYFTSDGKRFDFPVNGYFGAWCQVFIEGQEHPIESTALMSEYSTGKSLWASKPATMIRKVAVAQAHREAFPEELSGMYEKEEMEQPTPTPKIINPSLKNETTEQLELYNEMVKEIEDISDIDVLRKIYRSIGDKVKNTLLTKDQGANIQNHIMVRQRDLQHIAKEEEAMKKAEADSEKLLIDELTKHAEDLVANLDSLDSRVMEFQEGWDSKTIEEKAKFIETFSE